MIQKNKKPEMENETVLGTFNEKSLTEKLPEDRFCDLFYRLFDIVHVNTDRDRERVHRLRYQIFCIENENYEDPNEHPDGMEKDDYDDHSDQILLVYKPLNLPVGCMRIVFENSYDWTSSFPMQDVVDLPCFQDKNFVAHACEFSRLGVSRDAMREVKKDIQKIKENNQTKYDGMVFSEKEMLSIVCGFVSLGVLRGGFDLAVRRKRINVVGMMEKSKLQRMRSLGMFIGEMGDAVEYHGERVPFLTNAVSVYEGTMYNNPRAGRLLVCDSMAYDRAIEEVSNIQYSHTVGLSLPVVKANFRI